MAARNVLCGGTLWQVLKPAYELTQDLTLTINRPSAGLFAPMIPAHFTPAAVRHELRYTLVRLRTPTWAKP
jgi:hypothetical protein